MAQQHLNAVKILATLDTCTPAQIAETKHVSSICICIFTAQCVR